MKNLTITLILLFLIFAGYCLANNLPDGVSPQQWQQIKQQIKTSKYHPQVDKEGFYTAHNPAKSWQIHYATDGMTTIKNNDYRIGMRLQSIGKLHLDTTPSIEVKDNILYYQHSPQIKEWWVNSADKVEQWFSINKRPTTGSHELKVQIAIDTDTQVSQSGNQLTFTTQKGQSINYDKLKVWDSQGTVLPSRMQLADNNESFHLIVDDSQAKYPITIDPSFSQDNYIKPAVIDAADTFGFSVDIDGDIMVVSANNEDSSATLINGDSSDNSALGAGAAYVFVRNGNEWVQQAYLKASNSDAGDLFGRSVAISGTTVVVGTNNEGGDANSTMESPNNFGHLTGAAYVFTRSGTTWTQQAYLKPFNVGNVDHFGFSVAIDGNTIAVGSIGDDGDANSTMGFPNENQSAAGAVHIFTRSGSTWTQQAYLKASNAEFSDSLGISVAIDGDTVVVGAASEDGDANSSLNSPNNAASDAGAAYVFVRDGTTWSQQGYLKAHNAELSDEFGDSVAIDVDSIVVGTPLEDGDATSSMNSPNNNAIDAGAAYVFVRNNTIWTQQAYLKASNADASDKFAESVAIAGDTIVVGASFEDGDASSSMEFPNNNSTNQGATYVFSRNALDWQQKSYLKTEDLTPFDRFGAAVAINEGSIVIAATGEDGDANSTIDFPNENALNAGVVYLYKGRYYIGGTVSGLAAAGLVLQINGSDDLNINNNGGFVFSQPLADNSNYAVTVTDQPNNQNCTAIDATGTIASADVINVGIECTNNTYIIGVSVTGLTGAGLVMQNNGGDDLSINANGNTPFSTQLNNGSSFNVTILSQPNDPNNTCQIIGTNSGAIASGNVLLPLICGDIIFVDGFE